MKRLIPFLLALMLAILPVEALADVVSYTADFYVADHANVLSDEVEGLIVFNNDALDKACGAQIVVVTVDTVEPDTIENYAYTLFNEWKIGDKAKNNGLLILLAIQDGQYWLMPGKGLQDYLSAGELDEMANEYLLPSAQTGNYEEGVRQLFSACFDYITVAYDAGVSLDDTLYYTWLQTGAGGKNGAKYLSEPVREVIATAEPEPVVEITPEPVREPESRREEGGGFSFLHLIIILIILIVILGGMGRVRRARPGRASAPRRAAPPPPPVPPMTGGYRPTPPPVMPRLTVTRTPVSRPPMGGTASRPSVRPTAGGTSGSRPSSRTTSGFGGSRMGGGGMTRGGGTGGSFGRSLGGMSRPSGGSRTVGRSGGGFGGGRSGGGGSTRGGGSGGSFRGGR